MNIDNQQKLLEAIKFNYSLENPQIVKNIESWGNTTRLHIRNGNKDYFLKEKVFYLDFSEFKIKLDLYLYLMSVNGPIPYLILTIEGNPYIEFSKRWFELQEYIIGESITQDSEPFLINLYGKTIGYLSHLLNNYSSVNSTFEHPKARKRWFPDTKKTIIGYLQFLDLTALKYNINKNIVKKINKAVNNSLNRILWTQLPNSWIHGDIAFDNSIYSNTIHLIDFDNTRYSYRIWDICKALSIAGAFKDNTLTKKNISTQWNTKLMNHIYNGYTENISLTTLEKLFFNDILTLTTVTSFISEFDLDDPDYNICELDKISEEYEKLVNLLNQLSNIKLL